MPDEGGSADPPPPSSGRGPLSRFRVLDFSRMIAGPYCTQELADMGAEVIKVESPHGDDSRRPSVGVPGGKSTLFLSVNRNKQSIVLDLKSAAGRVIALDLATRCDVVVENFAPGVMARLGLGYDVVEAAHPKVIYCSISGYGDDDPSDPSRPAYDGIIQAAVGMMSTTGEADGPPTRTPYSIIDTAAAMTATSSILAALLGRDDTGSGMHLDISLFDVAMAVLAPMAIQALITGKDPQRVGSRAPQSAPSDVFHTADGLVFITCGNDRLFRRLANGLDAPLLATHEHFSTNASRIQHVERLTSELQAILLRRTTAAWMERFTAHGVPAGPVRSVTEALRSPDALRSATVIEVGSGGSEVSQVIRSPHRFGAPDLKPTHHPPKLGVHTSEVLQRILGWDASQIDTAVAAGAFGPSDQA